MPSRQFLALSACDQRLGAVGVGEWVKCVCVCVEGVGKRTRLWNQCGYGCVLRKRLVRIELAYLAFLTMMVVVSDTTTVTLVPIATCVIAMDKQQVKMSEKQPPPKKKSQMNFKTIANDTREHQGTGQGILTCYRRNTYHRRNWLLHSRL